MTGLSFADAYRAAGLAPGPDIIRVRQEACEKLRSKVDPRRAVDLTRMYFGLPVPGGIDWFIAPFAESDPSFSLLDNEREAAVLSACLLAAALAEGEAAAGLAVLDASFSGRRRPLVRPEFIEEARRTLHEMAVQTRRVAVEVDQIKPPTKSKVSAEADQFAQAPDWPKAAALFKAAADESSRSTTNLVAQVTGVLKPMVAQMTDLREELEMLWWYVGGWSRILDRPFAELDPALAAAMAGRDLADLAEDAVGPAAAAAILQRLISAGREANALEVSIRQAVDAFPWDAGGRLTFSDKLSQVADVCPVLTAFQKASEIGKGSAWHGAFKKATRLDPDTSVPPLDMAMQVYRESLLLALLD